MRRIVDKVFALRGLRIAPQFSYGISLALDIRKLCGDLT